MPAGAIEENLERVREWLTRDGFELSTRKDPQSHETFEADREEDFTYTLVHPEPDADHVFVGVAVPGQRLDDALAEANQEEVQAFLTELRFGLLGMGVEFDGLELPTEQVTLFLPAYFDGLSKDRFMEKLRAVKNAGLFLDWSLGPADPQPAPGGQAGGGHYIR